MFCQETPAHVADALRIALSVCGRPSARRCFLLDGGMVSFMEGGGVNGDVYLIRLTPPH